ncbi:MAG TPA: SDR family NAD(P)-dependent oxidoreductase [Candidatus Binataceae bacterium]|nr:SDR family NAD(P)-dependent oxidoreductase [Candidatus Binataceae bacterium]
MGQSCLGRVAIITGASRGIGQAIAIRLAAEGAKVALLGRDERRRDKELSGTLEEGIEAIGRIGGAAIAIRCDIADPDYDKGDIVRQVESAFGAPADILIHAAAAPREFGPKGNIPFAQTPREFFMRSVEVNVWSFWDLAMQVIPGMRKRGAGWILAITSSQAAPHPRPEPGGAPAPLDRLGSACIYGGTKAFLDRICTGAARELYQDNIAFNNLATTGAVGTPLSLTITKATEPMEAFVEAALALVTGDPKILTSRVVHSLPLLYELNRPVYTLDGKHLFEEWQPDRDDPRKFMKGYLSGLGH